MKVIDRPGEAERVHRRSVRVLVAAQSVGAIGVTIGVATSSLLAKELSGSDAMAGFTQTAQVVGSAAAAFGLARLMGLRGRRIGQVTGMLVGAVGASLCVLAGVVESMALLVGGSVLLGAMSAANSAARYAATDLATEANRSRSLSRVVWATTIGAVLGPNLVGPAGDVAVTLGLPRLTGAFGFGAIGMTLAALVVGVFLRPDPLLTAQRLARAAVAPVGSSVAANEAGGGPWAVIKARPALLAAMVAMACTHAVMVSVMIMTPLHMEHGGSSLEVIGFVISVHVLGMFAFSPVVGEIADRWGRPLALIIGAGILLVALMLCASAPTGTSWQIGAGLFLLGLGWSFGTVAAATIIADNSPLAARTQIQGVGDASMWLVAAAGGALAGVIVEQWGYRWLALFAALICVGVLAAGVVTGRHEQDVRPPRS